KVTECAQRELPRHLLPPLVDEVGVIEWTSFDVSRFSRSLDLLVREWLSDQSSRGFFDLDWSRRDTAEDDASVRDPRIVSFNPRRDTEHGEVEGATTAQFLIRSAPAVRRRQLNIDEELVRALVQVVYAVVVVQAGSVDHAFTEC